MKEQEEFRKLIKLAQGYLKGKVDLHDVGVQTDNARWIMKYSICDNRIKSIVSEFYSMGLKVSPGIHTEEAEAISELEYQAWLKEKLAVLNEPFNS